MNDRTRELGVPPQDHDKRVEFATNRGSIVLTLHKNFTRDETFRLQAAVSTALADMGIEMSKP